MTAKSKGNSWERECAKILTKVFGVKFERNKNGSGSFVGGKNSFRKKGLSEAQLLSFLADIIPGEGFENMCIECKFYKEFPFHHFLINKPIELLDEWIEQQLDIIEERHFWFVAFKINYCGSFIAIPERFIDINAQTNHAIYHHNGVPYIVADFEQFLINHKDQIIAKCFKSKT